MRRLATSTAAIGAALLGVAFVAGSGGESSLAGDALVFGSSALSALFIVAQPGVLAGRDPVAVTAVQMAAGALLLAPFALVFEGASLGTPAQAEVVALVGLIGVGSVLPFALYAYGQTHVTAEVAGAFVNLEPLVGAAAGALVFQEPFGPAQGLGAAAILLGVGLSTMRPRAARPRERFA